MFLTSPLNAVPCSSPARGFRVASCSSIRGDKAGDGTIPACLSEPRAGLPSQQQEPSHSSLHAAFSLGQEDHFWEPGKPPGLWGLSAATGPSLAPFWPQKTACLWSPFTAAQCFRNIFLFMYDLQSSILVWRAMGQHPFGVWFLLFLQQCHPILLTPWLGRDYVTADVIAARKCVLCFVLIPLLFFFFFFPAKLS